MRLERALAPLFPAWALRRLAARAQFDLMARAYDGASKTRRGTREWRAPGASSALEDGGALATLRNRSRDLVRNNPWARKAARQLPAHIVGTGVVPRPTSGADVTRRRALAAWDAFDGEADPEGLGTFGTLQHLAMRTVMEAGEVLLHWRPESRRAGRWAVHLLEPDFLDETFHETSRNGSGRIISGVEFDAAGHRVAYHLFRQHPGDMLPMMARRSERERVPAEFIDHVFERLRPGQVRGIPWLAASMLSLREMADYTEAERWRKKITAALAAFVTSPAGPAAANLGAVRTETDGAGNRRAIERIAPGTIKRLAPGEGVTFSSPPADQGMDAYLRWELHAICAGLGLPYAELTGDLSSANYGSMRAGKIEFWALLDVWQWIMVEPMLLRRAWQRVQAASGIPGAHCEWGFPKRHWVDPLKDVTAEVLAARSGLESTPQQIGARGYDWRRVQDEQAEYLARAAELGLVLDTDASKVARNGGAKDAAPSKADEPQDPQPGEATDEEEERRLLLALARRLAASD